MGLLERATGYMDCLRPILPLSQAKQRDMYACMCMYVCMYVCGYVCLPACLPVCLYVCMLLLLLLMFCVVVVVVEKWLLVYY